MIKTKLTIEGPKDLRVGRYRMFCTLCDVAPVRDIELTLQDADNVIIGWASDGSLNNAMYMLRTTITNMNSKDDYISLIDSWDFSGIVKIGGFTTIERIEAEAPAPAEAPGEQSTLVELTTSELALVSAALKMVGMQLMTIAEVTDRVMSHSKGKMKKESAEVKNKYNVEAQEYFLLDQNKFSNGKYQGVSNG